ncbi:hypothetical protein [Aeromonas caviae]|uniref:hypothetical protein n=1 Tax=Aeromonas caviae TaxID=648 RepID=UPI000FEBF8E1|nr:hypothetical protein [Aeromonas caviae]RWT27879.1 hypothetical protein DN612_18635 [Aeromonas caviae]
MSFDKKHGEFIFNVQEHLVTCELIGPFNEEGMLTWITEIKRVINSLDGKRFCALVDHRQHQGVVLSALPHLQETYQWLTQKNLVAIASLYSAKVLHHIALSCLSLTHPDHIRAFNDPQEAIAWLDAQYRAR